MTQQMSDLVDQAIRSRHSVRAFTNQMVEVQTLKDILHVASRAPSGTNTQPWKVYVVTGKKRDEIVERVCHAQLELFQHPEKAAQYQETFAYYPENWISPYIDRRRENGWGLYGLLNIQKNESEHLENNSSDSHQHTDRYRYYARSNELHGIKTKTTAHLNMRRVVVFVLPRIPVIKVTVIKVIKDFWLFKMPSTTL